MGEDNIEGEGTSDENERGALSDNNNMVSEREYIDCCCLQLSTYILFYYTHSSIYY